MQVPSRYRTLTWRQSFQSWINRRDIAAFFMAVFLLTAASVLYWVFESWFWIQELGISVPVFSLILAYFYVVALSNLFMTSWMDPGYLPKNLLLGEASAFAYPFTGTDPELSHVQVNQTKFHLKWCDTCLIYRPPRCSHCSICDRCIEVHDHHCPWTANCIGKRNYRFFFLFVCTITIMSIFVFATCLARVLLMTVREEVLFMTFAAQSPVTIILLIFTFLMSWSLLGLCGYHSFLISQNISTHEQIRRSMLDETNHAHHFRIPSFWRNVMEALCRPYYAKYPELHKNDEIVYMEQNRDSPV